MLSRRDRAARDRRRHEGRPSAARRGRASAPGWRPGVELTVHGDVNDYAGKGLSGGVIAVRPDPEARAGADEDVIAGNTTLYGATSGRAFFRGLAGERFAVRNSRRRRGRRGRRRPRLRVHDRRARGRARADRAQLRRGDERRDRLRARRRRDVRLALQPDARRPRRRWAPTTRGSSTRCCSSTASGPARGPRPTLLAHFGAAPFVKVIPHDYKARAASAPPLARGRRRWPIRAASSRSRASRRRSATRATRTADHHEIFGTLPAEGCASRAGAAWTAASRSATRAARSAT